MKKLLTVFCVILLLFCVLAIVMSCITYNRNELFNTGIFNELVEMLKINKSIDAADIVDLETLYTLKTEASKSDMTSFLYSIFSVVFITIGIYFISQINSVYEKTNEKAKGIIDDYEKLKKEADKIETDVSNILVSQKSITESVANKHAEVTEMINSSIKTTDDVFNQISSEYMALDHIKQASININTIQILLTSLSVDIQSGRSVNENYVILVRDCLKSIDSTYDYIKKCNRVMVLSTKNTLIGNIGYCIHVIERVYDSLRTEDETQDIQESSSLVFDEILRMLKEIHSKFFDL